MTVAASGDLIVTYIATGLTGVFPIPFDYIDDCAVSVDGVSLPFVTTPDGQNFSVTPIPSAGSEVVISRETDIIQDVALSDNSAFPAAKVNAALDRGRYIDQELKAYLSQVRRDMDDIFIRFPSGELSKNAMLLGAADGSRFEAFSIGSAAQRAGQIFAYDLSGHPTVVPLGLSDAANLLFMRPGASVPANTTLYALSRFWLSPAASVDAPNPLTPDGLEALGFEDVSKILSRGGERNAANAAALSSQTDGAIVSMGGLSYQVDRTATGVNSATYDLNVDGLIPYGPIISMDHFGAVTQASFDAIATKSKGAIVDMGNKTYPVAALPSGAEFQNGLFNIGGVYRPTEPNYRLDKSGAYFNDQHGVLAKARKRLADPLNTHEVWYIVGDSRADGRAATGSQQYPNPRNANLTDDRNLNAAANWPNELGRVLSDMFFESSPVTTSLTPLAQSGENVAKYSKTEWLFPEQDSADFDYEGNTSILIASTTSEGKQFRLTLTKNQQDAGTVADVVMPNFYGDNFLFEFASQTNAGDYEIYVDGVLTPVTSGGVTKSKWATEPGRDGNVSGLTVRTHYFENNYRGVELRIKSVRTATIPDANTSVVYGYRIGFEKTLTIINQAISGQSAFSWYSKCQLTPAAGDKAVQADATLIIIDLGTNDRGNTGNQNWSPTQFERDYRTLTTAMKAITPNVVCMIPFRAKLNDKTSPSVYGYSVRDIRYVVEMIADELSCDVIDNDALFSNPDFFISESPDGLHLNDRGLAVICRNIINSLLRARG